MDLVHGSPPPHGWMCGSVPRRSSKRGMRSPRERLIFLREGAPFARTSPASHTQGIRDLLRGRCRGYSDQAPLQPPTPDVEVKRVWPLYKNERVSAPGSLAQADRSRLYCSDTALASLLLLVAPCHTHWGPVKPTSLLSDDPTAVITARD